VIPRRYIDEWRSRVLWPDDSQVEQDLVISRCLVEIFNDEFLSEKLAFRGGTALYKLFMPENPRYSEDIDLVQIKSEPIKDTLKKIRETLSFLGEPVIKQKMNNNTAVFRFDAEIPPVQTLRLKIETNCREHFTVLGYRDIPFTVDSGWFKGTSNITTYDFDELLGTKLRALYQRKKGRDLYDIYKALSTGDHNVDNIIKCYNRYMKSSVDKPPSRKEYMLNLEAKMKDRDFLDDTKALLIPGETYNSSDAYELVSDKKCSAKTI
jgi:predicted nucleotidyltransferase component of viral defense system